MILVPMVLLVSVVESFALESKLFWFLLIFSCALNVSAWVYSAWVRFYALFLEERLECFRVLKYDVEIDPPVSFSFQLEFSRVFSFLVEKSQACGIK